jgi:outer membrane receptor for monomeric catechols
MKRTLLLLIAAAPLLVACGADTVAQSEVEEKTKDELQADKVDCPDDLKAEKDAKMRCTATIGDTEIKVDIVVTKIEDNTVLWTAVPVE